MQLCTLEKSLHILPQMLFVSQETFQQARVNDREGLHCRARAEMKGPSFEMQLWLLMHVLENNTSTVLWLLRRHGEVIIICRNYLQNAKQSLFK